MKTFDMSKYTKFIVYVIIVILLNIAAITLLFRIDLTANKVYSLSEASRNVVATLSEPLTVKVFFSSNLPAPYNNIERYLHDLLDEYAIAGKDRFNYQFYNVSAEQGDSSGRNQGLAQNYGIHPVQIQNIEQDEVKFQKAYMGMALIHGDVIETLPTITSTEGLEYQITSAVQKMNNKISALLRLKEQIMVKLFLSSSLQVVGPYMNITGLADLSGRIEKTVSELNDKNYGKLAFSHVDPTTDPEARKEAEKYNILRLNWNQFQDRRGNTIQADNGYAGIIIEHGNNYEVIKLIEVFRLPIFGTQYQLTDLDDLKKVIDDTVENVININEQIGYLADHGTPVLGSASPMLGHPQDGALSNMHALLSDRYSVQSVNLKEGPIPEGIAFLMIAGPTEAFSDYELYHIDQFLMKGKKLAIFMDVFKEMSPPGQSGMRQFQRSSHVPINTGLEKLLSHYGLMLQQSIVLDENSFKQRVPQAFGGGERQIYFAPIIRNDNINREALYLNNIKGLVMLKSSPVSIDEKKIKENELYAVKLFSSSEKSWEMKDRVDFNPMFLSPPGDVSEFRSFALAYTVEGSFPSYFADKPVPEKKQEGNEPESDEVEGDADKVQKGYDMSQVAPEGMTIKKGKPGKIFLIGTSEILGDNVIDEQGKTPNAQFVMNVIDYMNDRGDIAVMRSKTQKFNPIEETSQAVKTTIKTANIAGLPVLVVITGIIVWFRRVSRKRIIQKIFST